jgi:hypothetical protein
VIEIRQILAARIVRQVTAIQLSELRSDTVKKLQERYKFLKVPIAYEELFPTDPNQGIKFQQGTFVRNNGKPPVVIDLLQFLPNFLLVQTRTSTDDAEEFLDDYIRNANKDRTDTVRVFGPPLYGSEVEFVWDKTPDGCASPMAATAHRLDALVASYGSQQVPPYRVASIVVNFNSMDVAGAVPAHFTIEWRVGLPDNSKLFFSLAPLRTRDHQSLLETLDRDIHG